MIVTGVGVQLLIQIIVKNLNILVIGAIKFALN